MLSIWVNLKRPAIDHCAYPGPSEFSLRDRETHEHTKLERKVTALGHGHGLCNGCIGARLQDRPVRLRLLIGALLAHTGGLLDDLTLMGATSSRPPQRQGR